MVTLGGVRSYGMCCPVCVQPMMLWFASRVVPLRCSSVKKHVSESPIGGHHNDSSSDWLTVTHPDSLIGGNQDSVSDWTTNTASHPVIGGNEDDISDWLVHTGYDSVTGENTESVSDWSVDLNSAPVIGGNRDGAWSDWSAWSSCSADCDGGMQWRRRSCDNPQPVGEGNDCQGAEREGRTCNTHSCQGSWSCWSEFSPCSVTCGKGVMTRSRSCMALDKGKVIYFPCLGNRTQSRICERPSCKDDSALYDPWTEWSPCTRDRLQYRHRRCAITAVTDGQCNTDQFDVTRCQWTEPEIRVASAISETHMVRKIGGIYLIIVAIISFIIGGLASVGLYMYIQHHREQQLREEEMWKNSEKPEVKTTNLIGSSQLSLDFHNLNNNRFSVNTYNSLKKEKMTVFEASSLKKNSKRDSMWTNFSISDV